MPNNSTSSNKNVIGSEDEGEEQDKAAAGGNQETALDVAADKKRKNDNDKWSSHKKSMTKFMGKCQKNFPRARFMFAAVAPTRDFIFLPFGECSLFSDHQLQMTKDFLKTVMKN